MRKGISYNEAYEIPAVVLPALRDPTLRNRAQLIVAKMNTDAKEEYHQAWFRLYDLIESRVKKKTPSYEVHHLTMHFRSIFWLELTNGKSASECEAAVKDALDNNSRDYRIEIA